MFTEVKGDMFDRKHLVEFPPDALVITTNGFVKRNGEAVMGRGVALDAKKRWPFLPKLLGSLITTQGNKVHFLTFEIYPPFRKSFAIVSFPVKHNWWEKADLELIRNSAVQLKKLSNNLGWHCILMPRPGCGNGKRDWLTEVKPILIDILDERFHIISWEGE